MSVFWLRSQVFSTSNNSSAIAAAAYRSGEKLQDERINETHNYSVRSGVVHSEIVTPENTAEELKDRQTLWNSAEQAELKKDGTKKNKARLAREILVALPKELNNEQRQELAFNYAKENFANNGLVADINIHDQKNGNGNHHAHIMITTRNVGEDGQLDKKFRRLDDYSHLEELRESWETHANHSLEKAGRPERIDRRSGSSKKLDTLSESEFNELSESDLKEIDRAYNKPGLSQAAYHMRERGDDSWQADQAAEYAAEAEKRIEFIEKQIEKNEAYRHDLQKLINESRETFEYESKRSNNRAVDRKQSAAKTIAGKTREFGKPDSGIGDPARSDQQPSVQPGNVGSGQQNENNPNQNRGYQTDKTESHQGTGPPPNLEINLGEGLGRTVRPSDKNSQKNRILPSDPDRVKPVTVSGHEYTSTVANQSSNKNLSAASSGNQLDNSADKLIGKGQGSEKSGRVRQDREQGKTEQLRKNMYAYMERNKRVFAEQPEAAKQGMMKSFQLDEKKLDRQIKAIELNREKYEKQYKKENNQGFGR